VSVVKLAGNVSEDRCLSALVPSSVPPGPVTVLILPGALEDDDAGLWTAGIAQEWADELSDPAQDIYTLADGEPVGESG
jgi:hypothetical protein